MIDFLSTLGEFLGLSILVSGAYLALAQAIAAATAPEDTDADARLRAPRPLAGTARRQNHIYAE